MDNVFLTRRLQRPLSNGNGPYRFPVDVMAGADSIVCDSRLHNFPVVQMSPVLTYPYLPRPSRFTKLHAHILLWTSRSRNLLNHSCFHKIFYAKDASSLILRQKVLMAAFCSCVLLQFQQAVIHN